MIMDSKVSSSAFVLRISPTLAGLLLLVTYATPVSGSVWVYQWPYGDLNRCKCEERGDSGTRYQEFTNAQDCLESFSLEESEYCSYEGTGLTQRKCLGATSITAGYFNSDCKTLCTEVLTGYIGQQEFFDVCALELTAQVDEQTTVPVGDATCFSNFVYGWADYDPHNSVQGKPVGIHQDVDSPAACQELCQFTKDCVHFSWRAHCDQGDDDKADYQSAVNTCMLYDKQYMDGVLSLDVSKLDSIVLQGPNKYCDVNSYSSTCADVINESTFNPFDASVERCLLCGCVSKCAWKTGTHITGPRFCGDESHNLCEYPLSDFTTTTTTPECLTDTCPPTQECVDGDQTGEPTSTSQAARNAVIGTTTSVELDHTTTGIELDETTETTTTTTTTTTEIELEETTVAPQTQVVIGTKKAFCMGGTCKEEYDECDGDDC